MACGESANKRRRVAVALGTAAVTLAAVTGVAPRASADAIPDPTDVQVSVTANGAVVSWQQDPSTRGLGYGNQLLITDQSRAGQPGQAPTLLTDGTSTGTLVRGLDPLDTYVIDVSLYGPAGQSGTAQSAAFQPLGPKWYPFHSWTELVDNDFARFENRAPTTAELTMWRHGMAVGQFTPTDLATRLSTSVRAKTIIDPALRLFIAGYDAQPDGYAYDTWVHYVATRPLSWVASHMTGTGAFRQQYGSLSDVRCIEALYQAVLHRPVDDGALQYWDARLSTKRATRADLLLSLSQSAENVRRSGPEVLVDAVYLELIGAANPYDVSSQIARVTAGTPMSTIIGEFLRSYLYTDHGTGSHAYLG